MAVIAFYTGDREQTGNTIAAMTYATYLGIVRNKRILFISTDLNDNSIRKAVWESQNKKRSGLFGPNTTVMSDNGIEGLDRVIRSNKISPDIITDYTKVALTNRLEFLLGYNGTEDQYKEIQKQYVQIVNMAAKCYDTVIVDVDRKLDIKTQNEILNASNIVIGMTTQKIDDINHLIKRMNEGVALKKEKTLITIGRYDDKSKYNAKNISRSVLKQKNIVNTIPYNTVLFESVQEGKLIDMLIRFLGLKSKDENTFFIDEMRRLEESIDVRIKELQKMGLSN